MSQVWWSDVWHKINQTRVQDRENARQKETRNVYTYGYTNFIFLLKNTTNLSRRERKSYKTWQSTIQHSINTWCYCKFKYPSPFKSNHSIFLSINHFPFQRKLECYPGFLRRQNELLLQIPIFIFHLNLSKNEQKWIHNDRR